MRKVLFILIIVLSTVVVTTAQADYLPGYYYNMSGQKFPGLIDFNFGSDHISFKENKDSHKEKVQLKDISSVVINFGGLIGTDSLSIHTEDNNENKRYFAKFYFVTPTTTFYYKTIEGVTGHNPTLTTMMAPNSGNNGMHMTSRVTPSSSPPTPYSKQLIMYQDGATTYQITKENYIDVLSKAFADVPDLVTKIQNKEFKFKQLHEMINWYRNKTAYKTEGP